MHNNSYLSFFISPASDDALDLKEALEVEELEDGRAHDKAALQQLKPKGPLVSGLRRLKVTVIPRREIPILEIDMITNVLEPEENEKNSINLIN
jgi:hypothetical protein